MHASWQWSASPFQGFASPVATSKCHCLATQKRGPWEPALFCFSIWCVFLKAKEPKPKALGCKIALGKTGRGRNKTTGMFSCFVLPVYFPLKQSLLGTEVCRELGRAAVVPWRPGPSNQVVYQTLPGTGKTTTAQAGFASIFQKQPPKAWVAREPPCMALAEKRRGE